MRLNPTLKIGFKTALWNYHKSLWNPPLIKEIDFIERTVSSLQNINLASGQQSLTTRSKKIHLTPQVRYYPYGLLHPNKHETIEMGDILFIYKHFLNGILDAHRGVLVQVKFTKKKRKS